MHHADRKIFLHPGDFCFSRDDTHIHTVLGSCIAITLWHARLRVGGMCHFVLPERPAGVRAPLPDGRYAKEAWKRFRHAATRHGTRLHEYQGKIFGGSNMLGALAGSPEDLVGTRNAAAAVTLLLEDGVDLAVAHVGESGSRRIVFDIENGDVWVRHQPGGDQRRHTLGVN